MIIMETGSENPSQYFLISTESNIPHMQNIVTI